MPLYEYYCTDCQSKFDALRPMSKADAPIHCKNCESTRTSRALSLFATQFKRESSPSPAAGNGGFSGGCCGGGACGCAH